MIEWQTKPEDLIGPQLIQIWGKSYAGRTHLACTAKPPIVIASAAERMRGTVDKFMDKTCEDRQGNQRPTINIANFPTAGTKLSWKPEAVEAAAELSIDRFYEILGEALPWCKTLVVDTENALWLKYRNWYFGGEKAPSGKGTGSQRDKWGPVNGAWRHFLSAWKDSHGCDLILISGEREAYEDDKGTGEYIPNGHPDTFTNADVSFRVEREVVKVGKKDNAFFTATIKKAAIHYGMTEKVVNDPTLDKLMGMCLGEDGWK